MTRTYQVKIRKPQVQWFKDVVASLHQDIEYAMAMPRRVAKACYDSKLERAIADYRREMRPVRILTYTLVGSGVALQWAPSANTTTPKSLLRGCPRPTTGSPPSAHVDFDGGVPSASTTKWVQRAAESLSQVTIPQIRAVLKDEQAFLDYLRSYRAFFLKSEEY